MFASLVVGELDVAVASSEFAVVVFAGYVSRGLGDVLLDAGDFLAEFIGSGSDWVAAASGESVSGLDTFQGIAFVGIGCGLEVGDGHDGAGGLRGDGFQCVLNGCGRLGVDGVSRTEGGDFPE